MLKHLSLLPCFPEKLSSQLLIFWIACVSCTSSMVYAQTTPSEFAEMTLQDLFVESTEDTETQASKWRFSLQNRFAEYDGYRDGTDDLTLDEVLFVPGEEPRTDSNFPVVPTVIKQNVTILSAEYLWRDDWHFSVAIPWIQQETDHISIVPGYDQFLIESEGVGDVTMGVKHQVWQEDQQLFWLSAGVSLPTGSIDEQGDTPRAPGDQQLPYTMQLGSGTFDFPLELQYQRLGDIDFSLAAAVTMRVGSNDRHYRLGNRYTLASKLQTHLTETVQGMLGLDFVHIDRIHGRDDELLVPQPNPYPAGITNPELYGGRRIIAKVGLKWRFMPDYQLTAEFGKPLYQHLNGPQPKEQWRGGVVLSWLM